MDAPKLFIVAGLKGAGKSLFSAELTEPDFTVFGGDKQRILAILLLISGLIVIRLEAINIEG